MDGAHPFPRGFKGELRGPGIRFLNLFPPDSRLCRCNDQSAFCGISKDLPSLLTGFESRIVTEGGNPQHRFKALCFLGGHFYGVPQEATRWLVSGSRDVDQHVIGGDFAYGHLVFGQGARLV